MKLPIASDQKGKMFKVSQETAIEDAIIARSDVLGFSGANAIRNFRLANHSGAVDVVLLPQDGSTRLALVEAKVSTAEDAGSKVIGQLLMYYAGGLRIGLDGIELLKQYSRKFQNEAHSIPRKSPQKVLLRVLGKHYPNLDAMELLTKGTPLAPKEIELFIAINDQPHHTLQPLLQMLRELHDIHIGLVMVRKGMPELLFKTSDSRL